MVNVTFNNHTESYDDDVDKGNFIAMCGHGGKGKHAK
jgi:hypothetical protein